MFSVAVSAVSLSLFSVPFSSAGVLEDGAGGCARRRVVWKECNRKVEGYRLWRFRDPGFAMDADRSTGRIAAYIPSEEAGL